MRLARLVLLQPGRWRWMIPLALLTCGRALPRSQLPRSCDLLPYITCLYCACRLPQSVLQRRRETDMQGMRLGRMTRRLPQSVLRRQHETVMQGMPLGWMTLVHAGLAGAGASHFCSAGRRCRAARGRTCIGCGPVLRCLLTRPPSWGCPEHCNRGSACARAPTPRSVNKSTHAAEPWAVLP